MSVFAAEKCRQGMPAGKQPFYLAFFLNNYHNNHMGSAVADFGAIRKIELFSNLNESQIDFVASHCRSLSLREKEVLFTVEEKASQFYKLISGEIRVYNKNTDGYEEEIADFKPGDTIGDFDFARGAQYNAFAEATEDSHLIVFPDKGETMDSLAAINPETICSIMLNAIIMMTGRIKNANKLVRDKMSWVQELHRKAYEDAGTGLWKQSLIVDEILGAMKDPAALIMLKPDRFKILVDSRGHSGGDSAMLKIAMIIKNITRQLGHGWPLRFKSNEVGIIINNCDTEQAQTIAGKLADDIANMEPVPPLSDKIDAFYFTATVSWCVWPLDGTDWNSLFQGNYANLLDIWKTSGNSVNHYSNKETHD